VDVQKLIAFHKEHKADITVFVNPSTHAFDSDVLQVNGQGRAVKFVSKWDDHTGAGNLVNRGLCVIEPQILDFMDKEVFNFENYVYPKVLAAGLKMMAYQTDEFMEDMGTPERLKTCEDFLKSR